MYASAAKLALTSSLILKLFGFSFLIHFTVTPVSCTYQSVSAIRFDFLFYFTVIPSFLKITPH